jgi:hypothetical protein
MHEKYQAILLLMLVQLSRTLSLASNTCIPGACLFFFIVVDDAIWEGYGPSVVFPTDANVEQNRNPVI